MIVKQSYWWLLIASVLLLSIQILAVVIYIYSFIPLVWDDSFLKGLEPNRDPLFFAVFLMTAMGLMVLSVAWVLPQLGSSDFRLKFKFWLALESVWCFLMVFCFFKWTTYEYPFWNMLPYGNQTWLQPFFCVVCALALLSKIFFPEIEALNERLQLVAAIKSIPRMYTVIFQAVFIAGIILLTFIPNPQDVAALALVWDQWNHLDRVAGWFINHGWDISYEETIQILVALAIVYIIGLFYFIRLWLKSWLLAAIGALLVLKMGMFYYGVAPCVWINPANTFLAHGWDVFLFFGLWFVSVKYPKYFYMVSALAGAFLVLCWFKSQGYVDALGLDNQPLMAPLRVRQFFPYFMGYIVPLFYVFSLLMLMGRNNVKSALMGRLPTVLCIYGLMIFVDYLEHPITGFYGALTVPAILVMLWWLRELLASSTLLVKRKVFVAIFILCLGALLTNRLMLTYPNIIFQDKERFSKERAFYEHFETIADSASLIRKLTSVDQKVALLSNFEAALLMQADRQPLFKDFPVMYSSLSDVPGGLNLVTKKQCLDLINNLSEQNPLYVFIDARLLALSPQALGNSGLKVVLNFLKEHYSIGIHQGFLVALQRK